MKKIMIIGLAFLFLSLIILMTGSKADCDCDIKELERLSKKKELIMGKKISCCLDKEEDRTLIQSLDFIRIANFNCKNEKCYTAFYGVKKDTLYECYGTIEKGKIGRLYSFQSEKRTKEGKLGKIYFGYNYMRWEENNGSYIVNYRFDPIDKRNYKYEVLILPKTIPKLSNKYSIDTIWINKKW